MTEKIILKNKITVVLEKLDFLKSISFGIWIKNGSRNENEKTKGISHFIEHMFFKGTNKRNAKDIAWDIDILGSNINAFTSKEYTCYYFKAMNNNFDKTLEIIVDMFLNSKFDEEEIKKESKVIIEEINMYEDTPEEFVNDLLQLNIWEGNSLSIPILGTKESISSFNQKMFKDYIKENYKGNNIVISVCGNYNNNIIQKIENYFGEIEYSSTKKKYEKPIYKSTVVGKYKDIEQINFILGFEGIKLETKKNYTMHLFNTIFGGGMSSRLFQKIREDKGLVYSIYSYNYFYEDTGLFSIYSGVNKDNFEVTLNNIIKEIKKLKIKNSIKEEELKMAKEQLKSSYILSLEDSLNRMNFMGKSEIMLNKILSQEEIIKTIDNITLYEIYDLIEEIFNLEKISLCAVGNIKNINLGEILNNER